MMFLKETRPLPSARLNISLIGFSARKSFPSTVASATMTPFIVRS